MASRVNQEKVEQAWEWKRRNPNWSQREIASASAIGKRTVQRYLNKRWLQERGLSGLIGEEPEASNGDREVDQEAPDTHQSTGAVLERESETGAEGIIPKGQPVDPISPAEFRLWVNGNLDDLTQLIRILKSKLPGPRPALTPVDVLCPLTSGIWNDRLPILENQLRSHTRQNGIWTNISTYQRRMSNLRQRVDRLFADVNPKVEMGLKGIKTRVDQSLHEHLRQKFTDLLFYHAVAVALGEKGLSDERLSWFEKEIAEGHVELTRGVGAPGRVQRPGRGWVLPPVPRAAKEGVKQLFERLVEEASYLRLVTELRPLFDLLREDGRDIRRALDNLLVV